MAQRRGKVISRRQFLKTCMSTVMTLSLTETVEWDRLTELLPQRHIPVLVYHRVGPMTDMLTVSVDQFVRDMEQLKRYHYTTITCADLEKFIRKEEGADLPGKPVMITFDDGYIDNYYNAFPILRRFDMTATFFVITGMLGNENRLAIRHIREIQKAGIDFGSHTVFHRSLGQLNEHEAWSELHFSKKHLEDILENQVTAIAYPKGSFNNETVRIVQGLDYSVAFTVNRGLCSPGAARLTLPRIPVYKYTRDIIYEISNAALA